jgi:YfiH family protein
VGSGPVATGRQDVVELGQDPGQVVFTGRAEGDLGFASGDPDRRRRSVIDLPWSVARQVHGSRVVEVDGPGQGNGEEADALVTAWPGVALAVLTADCAPVAFTSPEGVIGVAHAGWRGLEAGVIHAAVGAMRRLGASRVQATLGPCIHPCCYQFGAEDLQRLVQRFGPTVAATDRSGQPALDIPAAVRADLAASGVPQCEDVEVCTACSSSHWSWRARADVARQATVVWR